LQNVKIRGLLVHALSAHYIYIGLHGIVLVVMVYGQNGDTEMATEMAIFQTATNPNNTYAVLVKPV